jgi:stearoyl-CoA desaturase (delta-9 desaturase)
MDSGDLPNFDTPALAPAEALHILRVSAPDPEGDAMSAEPIHPIQSDLARPPASPVRAVAAPEEGRWYARPDGRWNDLDWIPTAIYWGIHAACALVLVVGVSTADLLLFAATFWPRIFGITGGYHRYFSHKSYRTSRWFQFVLACLGASAVQKGPIWWSSLHRHHHRFSDTPEDVHPPQKGFWYSHQGWIEDPRWQASRPEYVPDLTRYPELVWLNKWHVVPPLALIGACLAVGGFSGFVWGFCVSTTLLWHSTYTINSLTHRFGRRRFETDDDSRNSLILALLTLGEGWHNNHHRYQAAARNGFYWWQVDVTYYVLKGLEKLGLVWGLREPPASVLAEGRGRKRPARTAG